MSLFSTILKIEQNNFFIPVDVGTTYDYYYYYDEESQAKNKAAKNLKKKK